MKKILSCFSLIVIFSLNLSSQVRDESLMSQGYNKALTQFKTKEYIIKDILNIPVDEIIGVEIDAITASKFGEISTVVYNCESLDKKGLVFTFWANRINDYNTNYMGYAFRNIEYDKAAILFEKLEKIMTEKKSVLNKGYNWNAVFRWEDLYFVFYVEGASNKIRVFWNGYDSDWNQSNLKTTSRRFKKSFK
jgi:hypothetical protein